MKLKIEPHSLHAIHAFKFKDETLYMTSCHKLLYSYLAYLHNSFPKAYTNIKSLDRRCGFNCVEYTELMLKDLIGIGVVEVKEEIFPNEDRIEIEVKAFTHEVLVGKKLPLEKVFSVGFGIEENDNVFSLFPEGGVMYEV